MHPFISNISGKHQEPSSGGSLHFGSACCRKEGEKFNIWQARLNLEMQYGDPPQEAVMKLFQRALSYTDQKKLYMAMANILEKAGQVCHTCLFYFCSVIQVRDEKSV